MPVPVPTPNKSPEIQGNDPNVGSGMEAPQGNTNPFAKAAKVCTIVGPSIVQALSTGNPTVPVRVPTFGYIRKIWLEVVAVGVSGAAVVAFQPDGPYTVFRNVLFKDVNGTQILNLDGYSLYLANRIGGYYLFGQENSNQFTSVLGASGTSGSFTLMMELPVCFGRDGLGALANMDASQQFQIDLTFGSMAEVFSVAPNTSCTVTVRVIMEAYANPPRVDQYNNQNAVQPPGFGTTQYWSMSTFNLVTGENTIQLTRLGNTIRNHILVFRDTANPPARQNNILPAGNVTWEWDTGFRFQETILTRRFKFYRENGFDAPAGVIGYQYTLDPEGLPIAEYGDQWWQTLGSTRLIIRTTPALAGQLQVITNDAVLRGRPVVVQ